MNRKHKSICRKFWLEWIKPLLVVLVVMGTLRSAVADWYDVPSGSMMPTILAGDRIFVNKLAYDLRVPFAGWRVSSWADPDRGDVVVLYSPADEVRLVKRVIGIPGDRIEMRNGRLFVNGRAVPYAPLDAGDINQIEVNEQTRYRFARETIGGVSHPVMLTPARPWNRAFDPVTLFPDQYFVMGDNRDNSKDSRVFGFVDRDRIAGQATRVVFSVDKQRFYIPRWNRFFRKLP